MEGLMKRTSGIGGALVALAVTTAAMGAQQPPPAGQGRPPARFNFGPPGTIQKVADNLYVVPGAGGNTSVFVTSKGVILVDTKTPNNGHAILDQVKTVTDKPVIYIVNTHSHFDHTGSNAFFPEAVEIVAHEHLAAALLKDPSFQGPDAKRGLVDQTYKDRLTLLSGDDAVDLYNFGPAHTSGDTFVVFRKPRAVATGDVFAGKGQPIIDSMNGGSGVNYTEAVGAAASTIKNVDIVIPGHAGVLTWQDFVDFAEFNRLFLDAARQSLKAGKTPVQAMEDFKATLPAKFKDYSLGAGMMTGPGGNFEPIFKELHPKP